MSQCFLYDRCNHIDCDKPLCKKRDKISTLYDDALLTADKHRKNISLSIDADGTDYNEFMQLANISKNIVDFVKNGENLYIHSSICGNGKTSWAIKLVQAYINKVWIISKTECKVLFVDVSSYLDGLKRAIGGADDFSTQYSAHISQYALTADLVVWDDVASKAGSEYDIDKLFNLINTRIRLGKANIFTSNLNDQELYMAIGPRLGSRIARQSINIELHGTDKRNSGFGGGN